MSLTERFNQCLTDEQDNLYGDDLFDGTIYNLFEGTIYVSLTKVRHTIKECRILRVINYTILYLSAFTHTMGDDMSSNHVIFYWNDTL